MTQAEEVYQRKFAATGSSNALLQGEISAGGMSNKNTEWTQNPYTWAIYMFFTVALWAVLHVTQVLSLGESTTAVNVIHGVGTFVFFHWIKGSPDEFSQGEWNGLTFWEQLDAGLHWTPTKKFLMLVPAVLCLIPSVVTDYSPAFLAVNLPICVILIIAKLPSMHRVRVFSINTTPGIDDAQRHRQGRGAAAQSAPGGGGGGGGSAAASSGGGGGTAAEGARAKSD